MQKGNIVTVYEDPITKKKSEGKAKLLKLIYRESQTTNRESWKVRFLSDGFVCNRVVG